jgi:hypothetical protein
MVEAGGVEPPSEDSSLRATTCVSGRLDLVPRDPGRQGSRRTIPVCISPFLPPGGGIRAIPLGRRPSAYTGTRRSDVRGYLGRVSVAIVVGDYWFPLFTRSAGPRHATREHRRPRRNRFAPASYRIPSSPGRRNTPFLSTPDPEERDDNGYPRSRNFALPRTARSMSRFASRAAMSSRLSYSFLPRARPISSFTCGPLR